MDYTQMSEVDAAYHILAEKRETMHYKDLILEVIEATHRHGDLGDLYDDQYGQPFPLRGREPLGAD